MSSRSNLLHRNSSTTPTQEIAPRTPAIEEPSHPLNLWDTRRSGSVSFPAQLRAVENGFDNIRRGDVQVSDEDAEEKSTKHKHLPWSERLRHTTWAYFTMTMATGGLANAIHSVPFQARWLHGIGLAFFLLNLVLYVTIWAMILTRFLRFPGTFRASLVHPTESLFVPAVAVSFGTICITIVEYGASNTGEWLTEVVWILFWFNIALAFTLSVSVCRISPSGMYIEYANSMPDLHDSLVQFDLHYSTDDADLDLSCIPLADHRTTRGESSCQTGITATRPRVHRGWLHCPGYRFLGFNDNICCIHLQVDDTEAASRSLTTRNVCVCWSSSFYL